MNYISIGQKFIKNAQNGLLKLSVKQIYQSDILKLQKIQNFTNKNVLFYVDLKNRILISSKNSDLGFSRPTVHRAPNFRGQAEKFRT